MPDDALLLQILAAILELLAVVLVDVADLPFPEFGPRSCQSHNNPFPSPTFSRRSCRSVRWQSRAPTLLVVLYPVALQQPVVWVLNRDPSVLFMQMQSLGSRYHSQVPAARPPPATNTSTAAIIHQQQLNLCIVGTGISTREEPAATSRQPN